MINVSNHQDFFMKALLDICQSILEDDGTMPMEEKIFWLKE